MSKSELLIKGLADANQWNKLHEPLIQAKQNIGRMKKRGRSNDRC